MSDEFDYGDWHIEANTRYHKDGLDFDPWDFGGIQPWLAKGQPDALSNHPLRSDLGHVVIWVNVMAKQHGGMPLPMLHAADCGLIRKRGHIVHHDTPTEPFGRDLGRAYQHQLDLEAANEERMLDFCDVCLLEPAG